jgi:hypothetical protein
MRDFFYNSSNSLIYIFIYTVIVNLSSFGIMYFVLDGTILNSGRSEMEQYKTKLEIMGTETNSLRKDNKIYMQWLQSTPNAVAYIETKLKSSVGMNDSLQGGTSTGVDLNKKQPYSYLVENLRKGEVFIDPYSGVSMGIPDINSNFEAVVLLSIPGKATQEFKEVRTGKNWDFESRGMKFKITVYKINWYNDTFGVVIREIL